MVKIAPSILSADYAAMGDAAAMLEESGADTIHVDIMDGVYVPCITFGAGMVKAIKKHTRLPLDVHLMTQSPERHIDAFIDAGADTLTFHVEACTHVHRTLQAIKARKVRGGVALNPATPPVWLEYVLHECDIVLVMSVNPGYGGQAFIPSSLEKIRAIRDMADARALTGLEIEVDGGICAQNAASVIEAGANVLVAGNSVFSQRDIALAIKELRGL